MLILPARRDTSSTVIQSAVVVVGGERGGRGVSVAGTADNVRRRVSAEVAVAEFLYQSKVFLIRKGEGKERATYVLATTCIWLANAYNLSLLPLSPKYRPTANHQDYYHHHPSTQKPLPSPLTPSADSPNSSKQKTKTD
jgi:hypothetical protein